MDEKIIRELLESVRAGRTGVADALDRLRHLPYEKIPGARVDHHRSLRQGIPEVVFAEGKTAAETASIARTLFEKSGRVLVTRADAEDAGVLRRTLEAAGARRIEHNPRGRTVTAHRGRGPRPSGRVLIVTAGTSDIPVAEEARVTAEFLGSRTETAYDVGVAGLHRILDRREVLRAARVIVVVAGMEGALPSVVGGLTDRPVVAVPTSVGYGASLGGLTALLAMLNSCVPGIAVMNIDNGFGAAALAHRINRR